MSTLEKITKIALMALFFLQVFASEVLAITCECGFDTSTYSAVAEGEGYCSSVTERGKDCSITFNGKVEQKRAATIEPSSVYGSINEYIQRMREINAELNKTYYLAAARDPNWIIKNLPLMIRSSYATVAFISHQQREKLDVVLNEFFKDYGKKIYGALMGRAKPISGKSAEVTKGKVRLSADDIKVVFAISIPEKF
jgi:hypothetical protein